jgi:two-component system, response regulator / RNA-binding antiterminator
MTRRPRQNFSGSRAVLFHKPDRNRDVLTETLVRLGLQVGLLSPEDEETVASDTVCRADVLFFDADLADTPRLPWGGTPEIPIIAVIGLEAPGRLHRAFDLGASAIIHKPLRSSGIYSALFFAYNTHRQWFEMTERVKSLEARHGARRFVQKAVLQLMAQYRCDDEEAFRLLRVESMRQRVTVEEFAVRVLADRPRCMGGKA